MICNMKQSSTARVLRLSRDKPEMSTAEIAEKIGVSRQRVSAILARHGQSRVQVNLPADLAQRLSDRGNGDIIKAIKALEAQ